MNILNKVRAVLATAITAGITAGIADLADESWTDLGVYGPGVGALVAGLVAYAAPENLDRLRAYIAGRASGEDSAP